jgi:SPP1 family predicted phage head-tail adaptor
MRAGRLRNRCQFQRQVEMTSPIGEAYLGWEVVLERWGDLLPQRGREQLAAGRLESSNLGTLQIRWSQAATDIDASHNVLIDGVEYQIRSIIDPDRRRRTLELVVETGIAQ